MSARTTLMTWIFWSPKAVRTTSNCGLLLDRARPAAAPAAGAAATAMGAAALTPNSSSSALTISLSSSTVMPLMASMSWSLRKSLVCHCQFTSRRA